MLNYIEERISDTETTLRGRSREKTLYVLRSVTNDASASDADRTRAQALLERLSGVQAAITCINHNTENSY